MRALTRFARDLTFYAADALVGMFATPTGSTRQVLLVRVDAIGDFVLWLAAAREFRSLYPDQRITLCVNAAVYDLAKALPYWDDIVTVDAKRFSRNLVYRLKLLLLLRKRNFDTVIHPTYSRVFLHGDSIVRASGARQRVGSVGDLTNTHPILKKISDTWYTMLLPVNPAPMMELERNAEFMRICSGRPFATQLPVLPKLEDLPQALSVQSPYFVIFPGASWSGRRWPTSKFAQVAAALHKANGWTPVLCGSYGDRLTCQQVIDECGVSSAINLSGLTDLPGLTEVLRSATLLVSNETSAVHLSVAVSTLTVCILGGGHYGRFMPYPFAISDGKSVAADYKMPCFHCNWHCTEPHSAGGPVPCISNVTVASVLERIQAISPFGGRHTAAFNCAPAK